MCCIAVAGSARREKSPIMARLVGVPFVRWASRDTKRKTTIGGSVPKKQHPHIDERQGFAVSPRIPNEFSTSQIVTLPSIGVTLLPTVLSHISSYPVSSANLLRNPRSCLLNSCHDPFNAGKQLTISATRTDACSSNLACP